MNRIKQTEISEPIKQKTAPSAVLNGGRRFMDAINIFGYFDSRYVVNMMPYIFFLVGLALLYIGNSYYSEKTIRAIDRTEHELKELRSEFITGKSELMYRSKLSEVVVAIAPRALHESVVAPKKIVFRKPKIATSN